MSTMRPDELASEERIRKSKNTANLATSTALGAGSAALGVGLANKILPFLNELIPADLAMKGISKVSPKFGEFLKKGKAMGLDVKEGINFIKEKIGKPEEEKAKNSQQPRNIIEEHAPDIHEILVDRIGQGLTPIKAAIQLFGDSKYKKKIEELQKKTGQNFEQLVTSVFGGEGLGPRSQQELNASSQPNQQQQMQQLQAPQQQPQQQTQQQVGVNPQLMQALQMAAQSRQRRQQPK